MSQDSLDKLEKSILQSINNLKDEIISLKDIVIKNLKMKLLGWKWNVQNLKTELLY